MKNIVYFDLETQTASGGSRRVGERKGYACLDRCRIRFGVQEPLRV